MLSLIADNVYILSRVLTTGFETFFNHRNISILMNAEDELAAPISLLHFLLPRTAVPGFLFSHATRS